MGFRIQHVRDHRKAQRQSMAVAGNGKARVWQFQRAAGYGIEKYTFRVRPVESVDGLRTRAIQKRL